MHGSQDEQPDGVGQEAESQGARLAESAHGGMDERCLHGGQQQPDGGEESRSRAELEPQTGVAEQGKRHLEGAEGNE